MRIEQLAYFLDVAKTKSLNASAERLYVTQPTISEAIHKLEEELESDLLYRSSKGVELSETGKIVERWAQIILDNIEQMKEDIWQSNNQYNPELQGDICVGTTSVSGNFIVPKILKKYMQHYPKVNIRVFTIRHYEISPFLEEGLIDLALFNWFEQDMLPSPPSDEHELIFGDAALERVFLGSESIQAVAHKNLPISKKKKVGLDEVIQYPLLLHMHFVKLERDIVHFLKTLGDVQIALYADNPKLLRQAVLDEKGIGLFAKSAFGNGWFEDTLDSEVLRIIHIKEQLQMNYYLAYRKDKKRTMAEKILASDLLEGCGHWLGQ